MYVDCLLGTSNAALGGLCVWKSTIWREEEMVASEVETIGAAIREAASYLK